MQPSPPPPAGMEEEKQTLANGRAEVSFSPENEPKQGEAQCTQKAPEPGRPQRL